jgi:hypothetical protein
MLHLLRLLERFVPVELRLAVFRLEYVIVAQDTAESITHEEFAIGVNSTLKPENARTSRIYSRFLRAVRAFLVVARAGLEPATH